MEQHDTIKKYGLNETLQALQKLKEASIIFEQTVQSCGFSLEDPPPGPFKQFCSCGGILNSGACEIVTVPRKGMDGYPTYNVRSGMSALSLYREGERFQELVMEMSGISFSSGEYVKMHTVRRKENGEMSLSVIGGSPVVFVREDCVGTDLNREQVPNLLDACLERMRRCIPWLPQRAKPVYQPAIITLTHGSTIGIVEGMANCLQEATHLISQLKR